MSKTPWTPGPWEITSTTNGMVNISSFKGDWFEFAQVVVRMDGADEDRPDGVSNARLIAAAPEMAEVLAALVRLMPRPVSNVADLAEGTDQEHPEVTQARALLARIRGEAE